LSFLNLIQLFYCDFVLTIFMQLIQNSLKER
jgi:hypothetical protein